MDYDASEQQDAVWLVERTKMLSLYRWMGKDLQIIALSKKKKSSCRTMFVVRFRCVRKEEKGIRAHL